MQYRRGWQGPPCERKHLAFPVILSRPEDLYEFAAQGGKFILCKVELAAQGIV
jgi:hypothetical protein